MEDVLKHEIITCRMAAKDYQMLREKSLLLGMSMSDYMRYFIRIPVDVLQREGVRTCLIVDKDTLSRAAHFTRNANYVQNNQTRVLQQVSRQIERGDIHSEEAVRLLAEIAKDLEESIELRQKTLEILETVRDATFIPDETKPKYPLW